MRQLKRIPIEGILNLRDLGGYVTKAGMVPWHCFYRSDLPLCDETGWNQLVEEYGLQCVIDLRSSAERNMQDYTVRHPQIQYEWVSLIKEEVMANALSGKEMFEMSMADQYLTMVLSNPEGIVAILELIAEHVKKGAVLYHCTAGKDRTGIISFFLYQLMEVETVDILADYQVSSTYNYYGNNSTNELLKQLSNQKTVWMHSQPETLFSLIEYFKEHDMDEFLVEHGMHPEALQTLKTMASQATSGE